MSKVEYAYVRKSTYFWLMLNVKNWPHFEKIEFNC